MLPSVATVIFSEDRQKVLLIKRKDLPVWTLPGGGVEKNETPHEAATRETVEETGYEVRIKKLVGIYHPINRLTRLTHLYECLITGGKISLSDETADIQFFSINNLPKYLPPPYKDWIIDAKRDEMAVIEKKLDQITYLLLIKYLFLYPHLVLKHLFFKLFRR